MTSKGKKPDGLELLVDFGGVSIGETTARLGVKIARPQLTITKADQTFTGKRLSVVVQLGNPDPDQKKLFDVVTEVAGSVDVKRLGVNVDEYATGLTFNLADVDVATLAKFSKGKGRLRVLAVEDLPDEGEGDDEGDEAGDE